MVVLQLFDFLGAILFHFLRFQRERGGFHLKVLFFFVQSSGKKKKENVFGEFKKIQSLKNQDPLRPQTDNKTIKKYTGARGVVVLPLVSQCNGVSFS